MKKITLYFFVVILSFSCKKDDEKVFPIEPYIEFKSFKFGKSNIGSWDSLNVEFYFRDGDADLGLSGAYVYPYHYRNYYLKSNGTKHIFSDDTFSDSFKKSFLAKLPELITYKDRKIIGLDTLPKFITPFSCTNWELVTNQNRVIDTVYYQLNPNFYNLYVDYYVMNNGSWVKFDDDPGLTYPNCIEGFNGRFPPTDVFDFHTDGSPFYLEKISSKEGVITYSMRSFAFTTFFSGKKIKLKVRIQDRAFHKSNEIETSEIQF
jgi:hypothetical protein